MMYIHYCRHCKRIHMLNRGTKNTVPPVAGHLNETQDFLSEICQPRPADRRAFRDRLGDPAELAACTQMCAAPTIMRNGCSDLKGRTQAIPRTMQHIPTNLRAVSFS